MKTLSMVLAVVAVVALARSEESGKTREVSLQDCLAQALEQNLDLQVERYNPQLANLALRGAYADYDPSFTFEGHHEYSLSGGGFNPSIGTNTPGKSSDRDSFSTGLGGSLPWGTIYKL